MFCFFPIQTTWCFCLVMHYAYIWTLVGRSWTRGLWIAGSSALAARPRCLRRGKGGGKFVSKRFCKSSPLFDSLLCHDNTTFQISTSYNGRGTSLSVRLFLFIHHFNIDHKAPCLPPPSPPKKKICITIVFSFSWVLQLSQEGSKTIVMHDFGE